MYYNTYTFVASDRRNSRDEEHTHRESRLNPFHLEMNNAMRLNRDRARGRKRRERERKKKRLDGNSIHLI